MASQRKNDKSSDGKFLSIADLINIDKWKKMQDLFSSIYDIPISTYNQKGILIAPSIKEPLVCKKYLKTVSEKYKDCKVCLPTFLGGEAVVDRNLSFFCPPGFNNFIASLSLEQDGILGYVVFGPVILVSRRPRGFYYKIAEEINVDPEEFYRAVQEVKVVSFYRMKAMVDFIRDIGSYALTLAYKKISIDEGIRQLQSGESVVLGRILDTFLNAALHLSGTDIGSIMIFDENRKELTIRASKGLVEDIVKNTRVKIGEGISGIAAKENTTFIINEDKADNRIRPYLSRPHIKSSMVLPITVEENVLGVINMGVLEDSPLRFNEDNVRTMKNLLNLFNLATHTPVAV